MKRFCIPFLALVLALTANWSFAALHTIPTYIPGPHDYAYHSFGNAGVAGKTTMPGGPGLYSPDTLRIHFAGISSQVDETPILLTIWSDSVGLPGSPLYTQSETVYPGSGWRSYDVSGSGVMLGEGESVFVGYVPSKKWDVSPSSVKGPTLGESYVYANTAWESMGTDWLMELDVSSTAIPEPSTLLIWSLLALCGIGYGWRRRKT